MGPCPRPMEVPLVSMRALVLALILGLALPALAQQPQQAQIAVNGRTLPPGVVLGSSGDDLLVMAAPYLQALGASVRTAAGHMEAWWPGGVLILDAGQDAYSWNGLPGRLKEPVGNMGGELVVHAGEIGRIVEARVTGAEFGMEVWKSSAEPPQMAPGGGPRLPSGLSQMPLGPGGLAQVQGGGGPQMATGPAGAPPVPVPGLRGDSVNGGGLGGGTQQQEVYTSPYQRPEVGAEPAVDSAPATPSPNASPGTPARAVVSSLDARRQVTFHLSTYEVVAKVKNEGSLAQEKPFQVQLLARGEYNDDFELLEAFLVRPLGPGEEVELKKNADGHSFQSLQGMVVTFKVLIVEDAPPPSSTSSSSSSNRSTTRQGDSAEKTVRF